MRYFRCYDCNHEWQLPHGSGGPGSSLKCPKCESSNVHRAPTDRGWARGRRSQADAETASSASRGYGWGRGRGRGGGRGFGRRQRDQ